MFDKRKRNIRLNFDFTKKKTDAKMNLKQKKYLMILSNDPKFQIPALTKQLKEKANVILNQNKARVSG